MEGQISGPTDEIVRFPALGELRKFDIVNAKCTVDTLK